MAYRRRKKNLTKQITAAGLSVAIAGMMIAGILHPEEVYAVTGSQVAKDGTYTSSETEVVVSRRNTYNLTASITVENGKITDIAAEAATTSEDNLDYFNDALSGIKENLSGKYATVNNVAGVDGVSGATKSSDAIRTGLEEALGKAEENTEVQVEDQVFTFSRDQADSFEEIYSSRKSAMDDAAIWKADSDYGSYFLTEDGSGTREFSIPTSVKEIQGYNTYNSDNQTVLNSRHLDGAGDNLIIQSGSSITIKDFLFGARSGGNNPINVIARSGATVTFDHCKFEGGITVEDGAAVSFENCTANCSVSFDANEGTGAPDAITEGSLTDSSNVEVTIPETVPSREGYLFKGYSTSKSSENAQYHPGDKIAVEKDGTSVVLYAIWQKDTSTYVLMNIPYAVFYDAEGLKADAVTSATRQKSRSTDYVAGSYHVNPDGASIDGITFPVKVSDITVLANQKQVTDDSVVTITTTKKGVEKTKEYKGREALFENSSYAYYILSASEKPDCYKELTVNEDGSFSFGKIVVSKTNDITTTAELDSGAVAKHGGDYEISLKDYEPEVIYAAIMHTQEGKDYAFRHLENIWTEGEFGFSVGHVTVGGHDSPVSYQNFQDAEGKTVTGFTVYSSNGKDEITLSEPLKLVPFAKTAAEVSANDERSISVVNLPDDAENVTAAVYYENEAGDKVYVTNKKSPVSVENGKISLPEGKELTEGITYVVRIFCNNYATQAPEFTYHKVETLSFTDVNQDQYYYEAVSWSAEHQVAAGYAEQDGTYTFHPEEGCTRAQFLTFLWRAMGEPASGDMDNPFTDVTDLNNQYYANAVLWAYENQIVAGYKSDDGLELAPDELLTRAQAVTFLWRAAGSPSSTKTESTFSDVKDPLNQYYGMAMLWASENNVVSGYGDGTFKPDDMCTRGQTITFLWRFSQKQ